jgi:hypothetical protein
MAVASQGPEDQSGWTEVPAAEVGRFLIGHRPPECRSVRLKIPVNSDTGPARHDAVLNAVLSELMNVWPSGTTFVVDYTCGYAQGVAYPPSLLTEIGQVTATQMARAVDLGWFNPGGIPQRHPDFRSQPIWIDNPVREWDYPNDTLPEISEFLAGSVRDVLRADPGVGYTITVFNDIGDDNLDEPDEPEPPGDELVEVRPTMVSLARAAVHR